MNGTATQTGAASVVNALATGRGAAFGLAWTVTSTVQASDRWQVYDGRRLVDAPRDRLAVEAARLALKTLGRRGKLRIDIRSEIPQERGLKSSSAVALAVARAVADAFDQRIPDDVLLGLAADAGLRSGTSKTGAFDDAAACLLGGFVVTDNGERRLHAHHDIDPGSLAFVKVPSRRLPTSKVRMAEVAPAVPAASVAWSLARHGMLREPMLLNTAAYAPLLGHDASFTVDALRHGAVAAGLSGKGPAEVAIVHRSHASAFAEDFPRLRQVPLVGRRRRRP